MKAHSTCWAGALEAPLLDGQRAQAPLERWHQVHDLLDQGVDLLECARRLQLALNTVKRCARDTHREHLRTRQAEDPGAVKHLFDEIKPSASPAASTCCTKPRSRAFLAAASGHRLELLFKLALHTGLRKDELLGLRWEDLDLTGGTANIRCTLQRTNTAGFPTSRPRRRTPNDASPYRRHALHSLGQHRNRQRHTGVAATVYTHIPLRLQRDVIDLLGNALRNPAEIIGKPDDSDEPPLCATPFR